MKIKNILIVHNSASDRELLSDFILSGIGAVDIVKVASEFKALQLLKERHFDVIFSSMILNRFAELPLKNSQVIALISEPTQKVINELTSHGIQQYLTFPINQQAVQNKLNSILRDGISRKYPRYYVPGTKVSLQHGITEIEGSVSYISQGGALCEFTIEGSWDYLIEDNQLTFRFPKQFGNSTLKKLECKYLITREIERQGNKTVLQIVFLLPILQGEDKEGLFKALSKAERLQNPILKWRDNRLEVKFFKHKYLFYKVHLFRLSLLSLLIIAAVFTLFLNRHLIFGPSDPPKQLKIVWHDGQLLSKADQNDEWQTTEAQQLPQDHNIRISSTPLPSIASLRAPKATPVDAHAVIRYSAAELVHITKGGSVKRSELGNLVSYELTGAAHLFIQTEPTETVLQLRINGVSFSTRQAHIYYQDLTSPAELNVIEGTLEFHPEQPLFLSIDTGVVPENGKFLFTQKHKIVLTPNLARITTRKKASLELYDQTFLPGIDARGTFKHIGYALADAAPYTLQRKSNTYRVKVKRIPVMVNDILTTNEGSRVLLNLLDGNRIKLYEKGRLDISGYQLEPTEGSDGSEEVTQTVKEQIADRSNMNFQGRIRVNLSAEKGPKEIRFQSKNASIHPEAAVFESFTHQQKTELLVLSSQVRISDPAGKSSMTVPEGMMSAMDKNQPPQKPEPIPRTKILNLLGDSLDSAQQLKPSSLNLSSLNQIVLRPDSSIPFYWNTGLSSANVVLDKKSYTVRQKRGSVEMKLKYSAFKGAKTGKQTAILQVVDLKGRKGSHDVSLVLLPRLEKRTIPGKIRFQKGQSIVTKESLQRLDRIAKAILADKKIKRISIEGHSDSDGIEFINVRLSQKRADVVKQYLTDQGIPNNILTAKGFGSRIPITRSIESGDKARNRRVEIVLTTETALVK